MIYNYGWLRVEGVIVPDNKKQYGTLYNLPYNTNIFYGKPEIQIFNKTSSINGTVYKVVPLSYYHFSNIQEIDLNIHNINNIITTSDKKIDIGHMDNAAQYYYEPFVIQESSVIFYADSTKKEFDMWNIVFVDQLAVPEIISLTAKYQGKPVPVGDAFELNDIKLYAIYSDGNKIQITEGYSVEPSNRVITKLGANIVKIHYTTPKGVKLSAEIVIEGVRKLTGITTVYDGPPVPYTKSVERKYLVVVASYSDTTTATVTDYLFPNGNIVSETNQGIIDIYYKGFTAKVKIPTYTVTSSRLIAFYNGPNVEVGKDFDPKYAIVKIYYKSSDELNSYYENIETDKCKFTPLTIEKEGVNNITVQYEGKLGIVSTKMQVPGIKPEVSITFVTAKYKGPPVVVGKNYYLESVICKARFSNGKIVRIYNGFTVNSQVVTKIGANEFVLEYVYLDRKVSCTFSVEGVPEESTLNNNYSQIQLKNKHPNVTIRNNRYRGPAESRKHAEMDMEISNNIKDIYKTFYGLEKNFRMISESSRGQDSIISKLRSFIIRRLLS